MAARQSFVRATDILAGISELWRSTLQREVAAGPARLGQNLFALAVLVPP